MGPKKKDDEEMDVDDVEEEDDYVPEGGITIGNPVLLLF